MALEQEAATSGFSQRLQLSWLQERIAAEAMHYLLPILVHQLSHRPEVSPQWRCRLLLTVSTGEQILSLLDVLPSTFDEISETLDAASKTGIARRMEHAVTVSEWSDRTSTDRPAALTMSAGHDGTLVSFRRPACRRCSSQAHTTFIAWRSAPPRQEYRTLRISLPASPVVRALLAQGRPLRVVTRGPVTGMAAMVDHVTADLTDAEAAAKAFAGAEVVYHCASVPRPAWNRLLPPLMSGILAGAQSAGAALVYGDNLYSYGRVNGPATENLPYRPTGSKERVRAELAETVLAAHRDGRVRAVIGRASDFFGPHVAVSEMGDRIIPALLSGKAAQVPPNPDMPHTYTFIDDFARALVTLGTHERAYGETWHVPSAPTMTTRQFVELVCAEAGTAPRIRVVPKPVIAALGLVSPTLRGVRERLHHTENPFVVDHTKFSAAFGDNSTPQHEQAVRATLSWWRTALRHKWPR